MSFIVIEGWQGLDKYDVSQYPKVLEKEEDAQKYCNSIEKAVSNDGITRGYYGVDIE